MNKLLLACATLMALVTATAELRAANWMSTLAGPWCETDSNSESWMWFKRGKCRNNDGTNLVVKANGDYVLYTLGNEIECKVDPKTNFKGWADYNCVTHGARVMKSKRNQKFLIDTANGELGLSVPD